MAKKGARREMMDRESILAHCTKKSTNGETGDICTRAYVHTTNYIRLCIFPTFLLLSIRNNLYRSAGDKTLHFAKRIPHVSLSLYSVTKIFFPHLYSSSNTNNHLKSFTFPIYGVCSTFLSSSSFSTLENVVYFLSTRVAIVVVAVVVVVPASFVALLQPRVASAVAVAVAASVVVV